METSTDLAKMPAPIALVRSGGDLPRNALASAE